MSETEYEERSSATEPNPAEARPEQGWVPPPEQGEPAPPEGTEPDEPTADEPTADEPTADEQTEAGPTEAGPTEAEIDRSRRAEAMGERPSGTEEDEAAEVVERAEAGDEAAEAADAEAGGGEPPEAPDQPDRAEPITEESAAEALAHLEQQAQAETPADDVTDVPTEEATALEAEAERSLASDVVEGEDEGPLFAMGADSYEAPPAAEVVESPVETPPEAPPEAAADVREAEEAEEVEAEGQTARSIFGGPGEWYVIHTYAGYENKVKTNLHSRINTMQMEDKIFDVVIPMEDVMEIKGGKKQVVQKKVFPGYLLVKMVYDNDSWYVVRNTPGVTGFVSSGTGSKPTPLSRREVEKILAVKEETKVKPQFRLEWEEGDVVRIVAGPFADFTGTIAEINVEQSKLKVLVNIFDRETPVELAFDQVAKT